MSRERDMSHHDQLKWAHKSVIALKSPSKLNMAVIISGNLLIKAESRWDTQSAAHTRIIFVIFLQEVNYCSGGHRCFCGLFTSCWQPDMMTHWSSCLSLTAKEHPNRSLPVTQLNETSGVCCLTVTRHPPSSSSTSWKTKTEKNPIYISESNRLAGSSNPAF